LSRDPPFVPNAADGPVSRAHPSILRHGTTKSRPRGESVSAMSKRVDFSLGMRDMAAGDVMSDVHEERPRPRVPDYYKTSPSRSPRPSDTIPEEGTMARTTSRTSSNAMGRASSDSQARLRSSHSTHRNRFFGRDRHPNDGADADLMEQGMAEIPENGPGSQRLDPRSGLVSPQAMRTNTNESGGPAFRTYSPAWEDVRLSRRSQTENYELSKFKK